MKILITGARGFIGSHLVAHLSGSHEIVAVVRSLADVRTPEGITRIAMNLAEPLDISKLPERIDVITHLAQANVAFPEAANELFAVNTNAAQQLLDYGRRAGARQFVLASSGDVYGRRIGACKETDPVAPASYYAVTKHAAENLARSYEGCLSSCVLRFFQPYGPGQSGRLIPRLAERIRQREAIRLNRDGRPRLTPVFVRDVVCAIERAIDCSYFGTLNIAGDRTVSVRELAEEIGSVVGQTAVFEESGEESTDMMGENTLMKQALGGWDLVALADGLSRTFGDEEDITWRARV